MPKTDYYASEAFIWDALIKQAEKGITSLYATWKRDRRITPFIITWPATTIKDRNGVELEGPVMRNLNDDPALWANEIVEAVRITNAYALLKVQQGVDSVTVILESQHGARCWTLPITRSGDTPILERPKCSRDREHVGLLWKPDAAIN